VNALTVTLTSCAILAAVTIPYGIRLARNVLTGPLITRDDLEALIDAERVHAGLTPRDQALAEAALCGACTYRHGRLRLACQQHAGRYR